MEAQLKALLESKTRFKTRRKGRRRGSLLLALKAMINDPEYGDMVFVCKDGERVYCCNMLIVARSPFFKTMLKEGWVESKEAEVFLPEISSRTLLSIMNFLYTEVLFEEDRQPSWMEAFEVLAAAKFLLLEEPVQIVWDHLEDISREIDELPEGEDFVMAANMLSVAMKFQNLWDGKETFVLPNLCKTLSSRPLEPLHLVGLSKEALLYFLLDSKVAKESQAESVSFEEYLKLRNLILWWICQVDPKAAVEVSISHLPTPYFALRLLEEPSRMKRHCPPPDASQYINSLLLRSPGSLESILSMIDLTRIHPALLFKVVEPLAIFSSSKMVDAYRLHLFSMCQRSPPHRCQTTDDITNNNLIIEKGHKIRESTFATFDHLPLCRSYGIYEWDVVIETPGLYQPQVLFPVIGIVHQKELQHGRCLWDIGWTFKQKKNGQCWVTGHYKDDTSTLAGPRKYGKKVSSGRISVVRVRLNMSERTCSFSYKGQSFENHEKDVTDFPAFENMPNEKDVTVPAFQNMPRGVYFPAVSLRETPRVEIKLVRGFDIS